MKKKLFLAVLLSFVAIFGCCFSFNPKIEKAYAAEETKVDSFYLLNGSSQYRANSAVGSASGYGNFKLGDKNISLTVTAKEGYKLVGWRIVLKDQNNKVEFVNTNKTIVSFSKQLVELQGTLTFDDEEETTAYDGEEVTVYTNATDGTNTYAELYKDASNTYYIVNSRNIAINITFEDVNEDGCNDEGLLEISEVFENVSVEPVFDFIYYKVEITNFVDKIKLPSVLVENFNGYKIYGNQDGNENNYIKTINTIIKDSNDRYFYVGNAYVDLTNLKAYAKHSTLQDSPVVQYVDMFAQNGVFRLGENVNANFDINIVDDVNAETISLTAIKSSVNIDVLQASVISNTVTELTKDNGFVETVDAYNRTSKIQTQFNIKTATSLVNEITLDYHNLCVVDLNRTINGKTSTEVQYLITHYEDVEIGGVKYSNLYCRDGEYYIVKNNVRVPVVVPEDTTLGAGEEKTVNDIDQFFKISANDEAAFIKISYHYSKISDTIYLAKSATDNNGYALEVRCSANYSEVSLGQRFYYYNFKTLDNETNAKKSFEVLSENKTINIDYDPTTYNIEFTTAVIKNGKIEPVELENNIETKKVVHGKSETINSYSSNVGYNFAGYALTQNDNVLSLPTSKTITINHINPKGTEIIIVYNYVDYTLEVQNLNKISIKGVYPVNSLIMYYSRDSVVNNEVQTAITTTTDFATNLHIGDLISLDKTLNAGFKFYGFSLISNLTDAQKTDENNFISSIEMNKDFIGSLQNNKIVVYAYEDYEYYTLTYTIKPVAPNENATPILMADIWATIGASAEKQLGSINAKGDYEIIIDNLKLHDTVNLHSKGKEFIDANGKYKQYSFNWFTVNGRDELSKDFSYVDSTNENNVDDEGNPAKLLVYTHIEDVFTSRNILVIYSTPVTQIFVKVNNNLAFDLFEGEEDERTYNINVTANGSNLTPLVDASGNLSFKCSLNDEILISLINTKIKSGYTLIGFVLENNVLTSSDIANLNCSFKAVDGNQTLNVNFKAIEYRFIVEQYGAGFSGQEYTDGFLFNDEEGTENDYHYTVLTVENKILNITKPLGYYVGEVAVNLNTNLYPNMYQTNNSKTDANIMLYSYSFNNSDNEFISFVGTYGDIKDNLKVITLKVTYTIYTYNISVSYDLINGNKDLDSITKPSLVLTYNGTPVKLEYANSGKTIIYKNIPYGEVVNVSVVSDPTLGVEKLGWFSQTGEQLIDGKLAYTINALIVDEIDSDYNLTYKLKYIEYTIFLDYDANDQEGEPLVWVNDVKTNIVILGDKVTIEANADREEGYTFDCLMYKYAHDEETWLDEYQYLYIANASGYELNTSETYNSDITYFKHYTDIVFETIFDVKNFIVDSNDSTDYVINFYLYYKLLEIKLINTNTENTQNGSITNLNSVKKDMHIAYEDYAHYTIEATDGITNATRSISTDSFVTKNDMVSITIQVNQKAQNRDIAKDADNKNMYIDNDGNGYFNKGDEYVLGEYKNEYYDLTLGLSLNAIKTLYNQNFSRYNYDDRGKDNGNYVITFNIKDIINFLDNNDTLKLSYVYILESKSLTVTTIIEDSSFYEKSRLEIKEGEYGNGNTVFNAKKETSKTHLMQFLAKGTAKCSIKIDTTNAAYNLNQFIKVVDINVYENGKEVAKELYDSYGIEKIYYTATEIEQLNIKGLKEVSIRFVEDLTIEFIVQPIIYFEGNEVVSENYTFLREYSCNNNAEGQPLSLTPVQDNIGNNIDITIPGIIPTNKVKITYTQMEDNVEKVVTPINVGTYNVYITFDAVTGYDWLSEVEIPINVYLEITPKTLYIDTTTTEEYITREYDGSSMVGGANGTSSAIYKNTNEKIGNYKNANDLLRYLILTDKKGVQINYADIIDYDLHNTFICLNYNNIVAQITHTVEDLVAQGTKEEAFKDVNNNLNIHLTNILLDETKDFNKNFTLYLKEGETSATKTLLGIMRITPREVTLNLNDIIIEDKVEDGYLDVKFSTTTQFNLQNVIAGDTLYVVPSRVTAVYDLATFGEDRIITIDPTKALDGINPLNYEIKTFTIENKVIYRYSLPAEVEGVGTFTLYNERGKIDPTKANLIPFGAELEVEIIEKDRGKFIDIYQYVEKYISNTKEYSVGYKLTLKVYGVVQPINNELFLSVPTGEKDIASLIELTGEETIEVNYTTQGEYLVVDLLNINLNLDTIVLLEKKALLKLWQIVLIVAGGVVVLGGTITAIVILRIRKNRKNELLEKI